MATPDFARTLDLYRSYLLQYKLSGSSGYKVAADSTKQWLDRSLANQSKSVDAKKKEIEEFVRTYQTSDTELATLKKDMHTIRTEGPKLQTLYETEREAKLNPPIVEEGGIYTRGAVLGGILVVIVGVLLL